MSSIVCYYSAEVLFFKLKANWKLTKNKIFIFQTLFILPPVWLFNLGSDLSADNIVWLDLADTKIISQDSINKVLELTEKWKYPNFRGKF